MTHPNTWLLVADAAGARIFLVDATTRTLVREPLYELSAATPPSSEIGSDRPGRTFHSAGPSRHAKEPPTDPHRYEKMRFAREVADLLANARTRRAFDRLVVVAPPQMLGDLRAAFAEDVRLVVTDEAAKDLAMFAPHELESHLGDLLGR